MCSRRFCEYWNRNKPRNLWNEGFIFDLVRSIFWFLDKVAVINLIKLFISRRQFRYLAVDTYIFILFAAESYLLASLHFSFLPRLSDLALQGFIWWRLFGLFRIWVTHFVISKDWDPINLSRTLILVFIGYLEIIISYTILAFILREHFMGIVCLQDAFYYSIRNAITIGSDIRPIDAYGFALFISQLGFVLLFLTSVVSRIISRRKNA